MMIWLQNDQENHEVNQSEVIFEREKSQQRVIRNHLTFACMVMMMSDDDDEDKDEGIPVRGSVKYMLSLRASLSLNEKKGNKTN